MDPFNLSGERSGLQTPDPRFLVTPSPPDLASLMPWSPLSPLSFGPISPFSCIPTSPLIQVVPKFDFETPGSKFITLRKLGSPNISGTSGLLQSRIQSPLVILPDLSEVLMVPDIGGFKGRLLSSPNSIEKFPLANPAVDSTPTLRPPTAPQDTTPMANTLPSGQTQTQSQSQPLTLTPMPNSKRSVDRKETRPVRLTANGKRIGRPPGTSKTPRKMPVVVVEEEIIDVETIEEEDTCVCCWDNCNRKFKYRTDMIDHVYDAHAYCIPKPFTCRWGDCEKQFKALYQIHTHLRVHTKEKPYCCPFKGCDKKYSRLENLKTHKRTHTGEKPFGCKFKDCQKTFNNASDCAKHGNRTHSDTKPYVCNYEKCTKAYTDPSSLRKHRNSCHPDYAAKTAHLPKPVYGPKKKRTLEMEKEKNEKENCKRSKLSPPTNNATSSQVPSQIVPLSPTPDLPDLNILGACQPPKLSPNPFMRPPLVPIQMLPGPGQVVNAPFFVFPSNPLIEALKSVMNMGNPGFLGFPLLSAPLIPKFQFNV